jgi:hypothetical protein
MILLLATRYRKFAAWLLLLMADLSFVANARAGAPRTVDVFASASTMSAAVPNAAWSKAEQLASLVEHPFVPSEDEPPVSVSVSVTGGGDHPAIVTPGRPDVVPANLMGQSTSVADPGGLGARGSSAGREAGSGRTAAPVVESRLWAKPQHPAIGGPSQPEMASFKSVNVNNMVNLFSGDFNYNIPLLDVGGYPVNLYYSGDVGLEQDASWVGLGWNINPGNVTRNMRGVPDDFNGQETLTQQQGLKPNITYGVSMGPDFEYDGLKFLSGNVGLSFGVSLNNYLGVGLDLGVKGGVNFKVAGKVGSEKMGPSLGASLGADLSSRGGLTLSPSASLTATSFNNDRTFSIGASLATSYNSRTGIKALQIAEQVSAGKTTYQDHEGNDLKEPYYASNGATVHGTSITFARPSYTPTIRMPMVNSAYSGHFQLGAGLFGAFPSLEVEAYKQTSSIDPTKVIQSKPMVGYLYYENATNNPNAVTDFTRLNDREVTPNTPIISAPQYTYDVFTIQGEGTGGSIRPYRSDLGFVRDNSTGSQDNDAGIGADIGPVGHFGANFNLVKTPTTVAEWTSGNKLHAAIPFNGPTANGSTENVLFRNPGEVSVLDPNAFTRIGGTDLVRFEIDGDPHNPTIEPKLDRFSTGGVYTSTINAATTPAATTRQKRDQVVDFFTADDATLIGLDKSIRNYANTSGTFFDNIADTLEYTNIARSGGYRLGHHISQINVTETSGKRYVYGLPVYNVQQQDYTFTIGSAESNLTTPDQSDTITYDPTETSPVNNASVQGGVGSRDGYVSVTQTPAYAHSFLLTGLLSPDYVDMTGDGITDDDLGQAVKFNYSEMSGTHNWRTPVGANIANFNPGTRSQVKDDKGLLSYGQRESWYLHSIESKTMIAIFLLEPRNDGKGVSGVSGGINTGDASSMALKEIDLYSKSDLRLHGLTGTTRAKPIKSVFFSYSYSLCQGTRDNTLANGGGRLTLDSVWFTFNGQARANKDKYAFSYIDSSQYTTYGPAVNYGNPNYVYNATDRWGTYKPASMNPGSVKNSDFPYTIQEQAGQSSPKPQLDANAGAWSLKRILLPSGGQIEVGYESDDYAYVQNKRSSDMLSIAGFGSTQYAYSNRLFDISWSGGIVENNYLFVNVPSPCADTSDVYAQYLQGVNQIAVRLDVNVPAGTERIPAYATIDSYGVLNPNVIWIKLTPVNNVSPLSLAAVEYLKDQLPAEAFPGYDVSSSSGLQQVADALVGMLDNLETAFGNPVSYLRSQGMVQTVVLGQCFARLNDPDAVKYGGGSRVKWIKLMDNWKAMNNQQQFTSVYTQTYDYTTTEVYKDSTRKISSGVASYEPGIGGDENPFQTIVQVQNKLPMGPISYGAIEMPMLESFFPAPMVGYSQVTVRSISSVPPQGQKSRSGIGRQVTNFYTAKDFPVYYSNTGLDPSTDIEAHDASTTNFFHKYAFDSRALSQGFLVATNDMHGKMKSQTSYADNDTTLIVNYTQDFYRNTGVNGLNETFNFVSSAAGGVITPGNLGIDIELMTDTREFTVNSQSLEVQGQFDLYPVFFPFWLPFIWPVSGSSENNYRAVTTTKVINYKAVLDSVVVYDKGSMVSTKNLVYDAQTGQVIVTRTNNEFNQPIYSTTYPAWWAYDGMGPAYENTEARYSSTSAPLNFTNGLLVSSPFNTNQFVSGDELYVTYTNATGVCPVASPALTKLWVMDLNKNNAPFPVTTPSFIFIDSVGNPYTNTTVNSLRIIRSGRRNMLDEKGATITSVVSPIRTSGSNLVLLIDSTSNVINATGTEFSEKWQTDQDEIRTYTSSYNSGTCSYVLTPNCSGTLETAINPYRKGLLGVFRSYRNLVFYNNRTETNPVVATNLSKNGFLANFQPYWNFSGSGLVPNTTSPLWVENIRTTRVNAQGLELETKNALGIYTAAQYGYNKTLPVAVTNNSPYFESAYEGFEDNAYNQSVETTNYNPCPLRQIGFIGMPNTQLVFTDTTTFAAHTGKYCMGVTQNSTASLLVPISAGPTLTYNLAFGSTTTQVLTTPGFNTSNMFPTYPNTSVYYQDTTLNYGSAPASTTVNMYDWGNPGRSAVNYGIIGINWDCYIQVATKQTYNFTININSNYTFANQASTFINSHSFTITDLAGNVYAVPSVGFEYSASNPLNPQSQSSTLGVSLCPGIYHLQGTCTDILRTSYASSDMSHDVYSWSCSNCGSQVYKTSTTTGGCTSTTAIPGSSTMFNPTFSVPASTQMLISAWVRESPPNTGSGADTAKSYNNDQIRIYNGTKDTTFYPVGPVIDGWQRYEGVFTSAASGTDSINFVNNTSNMIYFDDIRVHPFNAEMKSYVYDPVSLRLVAELDANNYATFYEYDEEGTPVRTKAETQRGIQMIKETRSAKQKNITSFQ